MEQITSPGAAPLQTPLLREYQPCAAEFRPEVLGRSPRVLQGYHRSAARFLRGAAPCSWPCSKLGVPANLPGSTSPT